MTTIPAGTTKQSAAGSTCATEPCDADATTDVMFAPTDSPCAFWVPVCDWHLSTAGIKGLEFIVELHGFIDPPESDAA